MKIAVIGSRSFNNYPKLVSIMDQYLPQITLFISGGAKGADSLGENWAVLNHIPTKIFYPNHKLYKDAFVRRNKQIVQEAELIVAFWNGFSPGTAHAISYAKTLEKALRIISP